MNLLASFQAIDTFIFDMDGVLTDGTVLVLDNGIQARRMSIRDGFALQLAVKQGYRVAIISGANSEPVRQRLNGLGIHDVYMGVKDKTKLLQEYQEEHKLDKDSILYLGDDLPDLDVMQHVGLACCPADAAIEIREIATYVSPHKGGEGCARDVLEKVMRLHNKWKPEPDIAAR